MRKLRYNVYNNISEEQYFAVQDKLIKVEAEMAMLLISTNWHIIPTSIRKDGLFIDFFLNDPDFHGSFGITFDDQPQSITFSCSVLKSFDENNYQYFLRYPYLKTKDLIFLKIIFQN